MTHMTWSRKNHLQTHYFWYPLGVARQAGDWTPREADAIGCCGFPYARKRVVGELRILRKQKVVEGESMGKPTSFGRGWWWWSWWSWWWWWWWWIVNIVLINIKYNWYTNWEYISTTLVLEVKLSAFQPRCWCDMRVDKHVTVTCQVCFWGPVAFTGQNIDRAEHVNKWISPKQPTGCVCFRTV